MQITVQGLERRTGEYQGYAYDNTNIHATYESRNVIGNRVDRIKVKTAVLNDALKRYGCNGKDLIGQTLDISFDRWNTVEYLDIVPAPGK